MKFDTRTLESIHRLNTGSTEWLRVVEELEKQKGLIIQKSIASNVTDDVLRYQGQLRFITSLLSILDSASETLHKRKEIK